MATASEQHSRQLARAASGPCLEQHPEGRLVEDRSPRADTALSNFEPGLSPTTTKSVFFDTEPTTLPPRAWMASARAVAGEALQRAGDDDGQPLERSRALVDLVLLEPDTGLRPLARRSPGASRRRTSRAPPGRSPGRPRRSRPAPPATAARIASMRPERRGRAPAPRSGRRGGWTARPAPATAGGSWPPRWSSSSLRPLAVSPPSLSVNSATRLQLVLGQVEHVSLVAAPRRPAAGRPRPRSRAPRCRTPPGRPGGTAARAAGPGTTGCSGSGCRRRPPSRACSSVPQSGQWVGITNARSLPSRSSTTGPTISGMTSPALRSTTVSPISTPLRTTSEALCSVAMLDRRAADEHRLHHPERASPARCARR